MAKKIYPTNIFHSPPTNPQQYDPQAFGNGENITANPATLISFIWTNNSASTLWLMFFDATAIPANTTVPIIMPVQMLTHTNGSVSFNDGTGSGTLGGLPFLTGLTWAVSTTAANLTADSTNSVWMSARYIG